MKRALEKDAETIQEAIRKYLENCPHDISTLYQEEDIDQLSWDIAGERYESAMEDKADMLRDEKMLDAKET